MHSLEIERGSILKPGLNVWEKKKRMYRELKHSLKLIKCETVETLAPGGAGCSEIEMKIRSNELDFLLQFLQEDYSI